jgi:hypothetical protein
MRLFAPETRDVPVPLLHQTTLQGNLLFKIHMANDLELEEHFNDVRRYGKGI